MNQVAIIETDAVVASMSRARMALAEARTIQQTKLIVDTAAAAEIYAKRQKLGEEASELALSIKIEALRKLGEMLAATPRHEGAKGIGKSAVPKQHRTQSAAPGDNHTPTLAELGLTKKESSVAQKLAALPEEDFQQVRDGHVTVAKAIAAVDSLKTGLGGAKDEPPQPSKPLPEDDAYAGPTEAEIQFHAEQEAADQKAIALILDSNEPLAALKAEYDRQSLELATVKASRDGFMNRCNELIRRVKTLRAKLDKLEREHGKSV